MDNYTLQTDHFYMHKDTPPAVVQAIERLYTNKHRARFFWGDNSTGRYWGDEYMVLGRVGRSTGPKPIALLIDNARSMGGPAISTDAIVRIIDTNTRRELYRHPAYNQPDYAIRPFSDNTAPDLTTEVVNKATSSPLARFKSYAQAERWIDFMLGNRFNK